MQQKGAQFRNFKKEALQEARFTEIERDNRILLERMANIMKFGNKHNPNRPKTVQPNSCKENHFNNLVYSSQSSKEEPE